MVLGGTYLYVTKKIMLKSDSKVLLASKFQYYTKSADEFSFSVENQNKRSRQSRFQNFVSRRRPAKWR